VTRKLKTYPMNKQVFQIRHIWLLNFKALKQNTETVNCTNCYKLFS